MASAEVWRKTCWNKEVPELHGQYLPATGNSTVNSRQRVNAVKPFEYDFSFTKANLVENPAA